MTKHEKKLKLIWCLLIHTFRSKKKKNPSYSKRIFYKFIINTNDVGKYTHVDDLYFNLLYVKKFTVCAMIIYVFALEILSPVI